MSALHGLQARVSEFDDRNVRIFAVSPDLIKENRKVSSKLKLDFPILSDIDLELTRALDLVHEGAGPMKERPDVPRPAVLIVNEGMIQWRFLTDNVRVRIRPDTLLTALDEILRVQH